MEKYCSIDMLFVLIKKGYLPYKLGPDGSKFIFILLNHLIWEKCEDVKKYLEMECSEIPHNLKIFFVLDCDLETETRLPNIGSISERYHSRIIRTTRGLMCKPLKVFCWKNIL